MCEHSGLMFLLGSELGQEKAQIQVSISTHYMPFSLSKASVYTAYDEWFAFMSEGADKTQSCS